MALSGKDVISASKFETAGISQETGTTIRALERYYDEPPSSLE